MNREKFRRTIALPLAVVMLLYGWGGCASGRSDILAQYDTLPYTDSFLYTASQDELIRAVSDALYDRGGVVTMVDHATGLVTAELETGDVLAEEAHAAADASEETILGMIFAGIVAVFIFIILFGWLGDGCNNDDEEDGSGRTRERGRKQPRERIGDHDWNNDGDIIIVHPEPPSIKGFTYVLTFTITPGRDDEVRLRMRTLRQESENGVVVRTTRMNNKYLNYSLRDAIRSHLPRP
jgi:hypothetical protein